MLCLLNSPFSPARQLLSWQQRSEPRFWFVLGWNQIDKPLKTAAGIWPLVITEWPLILSVSFVFFFLFFGFFFFYLIHSFEITSGCLIYLKDWPRHSCAEPLRAIQRKRKAGFLQSHKEEKEKIPNGNLSSTCQCGMDALVHAYYTVCHLCILNLLLPNSYHICRNMKSFFVFVQCHVSLPWIVVLCIADAGPWRKASCHQEISFPSV